MLEEFHYENGKLFAEAVPVADLAQSYGTPLFIYSRKHLESQYRRLTAALADVAPTICYSVKGNSNRAVLEVLAGLGAGADVVSGGELFRALRAGFPAGKIAFAGVGKTVAEIEYAISVGILYFTVESEGELERISECAARLGKTARIAIRVNPDVDPKTHKYTSTGKKENKFGIDLARAEAAYATAAELPGIEIAGVHMHLGSPISSIEPYAEAIEKVTPLCLMLKELHPVFRHLDIGGGLSIPYRPDAPLFDVEGFAAMLKEKAAPLGLQLALEPGRFISGNAGILVSEVQYVKDNPFKKFVIADAAMNDLIRPPLYQAHHEIIAVDETDATIFGDVVGPICESGDFMAQERELPAVAQGDLIAVLSAGAYGFVMGSNYNSRGRAAEVLVDGSQERLVRRRETWEDLVACEEV
jgi:diaminopimelate decarboxylase